MPVSTGTPTTPGVCCVRRAWCPPHTQHSPYLKQRDIAALVYLTSSDTHFGGGALEFEVGSPRSIHPQAGRLVCYPASHVHRVAPVTWGTREALTLWFTCGDGGLSGEDNVVLQTLRACLAGMEVPRHARSMYTLPDGSDLRMRRLASCMAAGMNQKGVPACCWEADNAQAGDSCHVSPVEAADQSACSVVGGMAAWRAFLQEWRVQWHDAVGLMVRDGLHNAAHTL